MRYLLLPAIVILVIWTYQKPDKPREAEVVSTSHATPEAKLQDCLDRADSRNQSNRAMGYKAMQYLIERKREDMEECRLRYGH